MKKCQRNDQQINIEVDVWSPNKSDLAMAQIHRLVEPMKKTVLSRGYGQVVCVLAFTSNDPSSNSAEVHSSAGFELGPVNFCEKNKNKWKRGWECHVLKSI